MKTTIATLLAAIAFPAMAAVTSTTSLKVENQQARRVDSVLRLTADINLDGVSLPSTRQFFLTPVLEDNAGNSEVLPSLLVNGRSMQIAWERKSLGGKFRGSHDVAKAVRRNNGKAQTVEYSAEAVLEKWMWRPDASVRWVVDTCGCGHEQGSRAGEPALLGLNPAGKMRVAYVTPAVAPLPVSVHDGEAHVNFEVNKSDLHDQSFRCKNGKVIDNRGQLRVIDDSIRYALADKNVEIAGLSICGYASPEGTYLSNERLATDRSRALSQYITGRYNIPAGVSKYDAVAENWEGLRRIVETTPALSETQRRELLALIDRPVYGPSDYDAKDRELKTDSRFAALYRETILPEWYPSLRTTKFKITTRLKPLSDEALAEVIRSTPEKMSLNQMFRVARLYPEGSDDFYRVMQTALEYFPEDETANLNMASAMLHRGDLEGARKYLDKAGDTPEALNARGILATWEGELKEADALFRAAGALPEAAKNAEMIR